MRRDRFQRQAYALRRLTLAMDRVICAKTATEKGAAARWVEAWNRVYSRPTER
jgi:hypothetical protein